MQTGQKYTGRFTDAVGDHRALLKLKLKRSADKLLWHLEQLPGERYHLSDRQAAMSLIHGLGQRVGNPRANSHHGRFLDAELHRNRVGGLEADAADISRQPIRVFRHDLDGIRTVSLVNADCPCRTNPMAVQKDHDLAYDLLLSPGIGDALGADRAGDQAVTRSCQTPSRRKLEQAF